MEYMPQYKISKEDFLVLSDLAGEMSIMDYVSKVIHEHVVAAQQSFAADGFDSEPKCMCPADGLWAGCPVHGTRRR